MSASEMHLDSRAGSGGAEQQAICPVCSTAFSPKRSWQTFCGSKCRNEHHARKAREEAMRRAAPELFEALLTARGAIRGKDLEHVWLNYPDKPELTLGGKIDAALAKAGYREPKAA